MPTVALSQEAACSQVTAVETSPPPLPRYEQPPVPAPGYLWSPGYWSWDEDAGDYYWVPGTWVQPPRPGLLWTPGYWGWLAGAYIFHPGYWGERVGFYGGVNYGFGYSGIGYEGGRWDRGQFYYNTAVNNVRNVAIRNVYQKTVVVNETVNNVSYNGGRGGIEARPTAADRTIAKEQHFAPTPLQRKHVEVASHDTRLFNRANGGAPPVVATPRPTVLNGREVVRPHTPAEVGPSNTEKPRPEDLKGARPEDPSRQRLEDSRRPAEAPAPARKSPADEAGKAAPRELERERTLLPEAAPRSPAPEERSAIEHKRREQAPPDERRREEIRVPEARPESAPRSEPRPEPMARPATNPETESRPEGRPAARAARPEPRIEMGAPPRRAPLEGERRPEQH
ncbi:YXWGXW repeat-containing protein [Bradyrhizobium pachyrhizi]|nr:YXWGXW repeat-containing protein [Bradyrhizobium pachyrhizi]